MAEQIRLPAQDKSCRRSRPGPTNRRRPTGRVPKQRHRHHVAHDVRLPLLLVNCLWSRGETSEVDAAIGAAVSGSLPAGAGTFAGVGRPVVPLEPEAA